jgi:hypothetical protein
MVMDGTLLFGEDRGLAKYQFERYCEYPANFSWIVYRFFERKKKAKPPDSDGA